MSPVHLFPCPACSHPVPLELRQAGQSLACPECQQSFDAPKLRELRQLPVVGNTVAPQSSAVRKKIRSGMLAIGLGLVLLFGSSGFALYRHAAAKLPRLTPDQVIELQNQDIEQASINQLYGWWDEVYPERHKVEWQETEVKSQIAQGERLILISYGLFGIAAVGGCLALTALVWRTAGTRL